MLLIFPLLVKHSCSLNIYFKLARLFFLKKGTKTLAENIPFFGQKRILFAKHSKQIVDLDTDNSLEVHDDIALPAPSLVLKSSFYLSQFPSYEQPFVVVLLLQCNGLFYFVKKIVVFSVWFSI